MTITPNAAMPDKGVYGGYIEFTPQGGEQEYRVPYAGFKGDYQSIQALVGPRLVKLTACAGILRGNECFAAATGTYVAPGNDPFTFVQVSMRRRSSRSTSTTRHGASRSTLPGNRQQVDRYGAQPRLPPAKQHRHGFFAFVWDGNAKKGQGHSHGKGDL